MQNLHGRNLRRGRRSEPGRVYLVTTVTHQRLPHFRDFYLGRLLVHVLRGESPRAQTLAYVVMPDHLHWLLQLGDGHSLSRVVADVKSVSSRRIGAACSWRGSLWQAGFHDHALRSGGRSPRRRPVRRSESAARRSGAQRARLSALGTRFGFDIAARAPLLRGPRR